MEFKHEYQFLTVYDEFGEPFEVESHGVFVVIDGIEHGYLLATQKQDNWEQMREWLRKPSEDGLVAKLRYEGVLEPVKSRDSQGQDPAEQAQWGELNPPSLTNPEGGEPETHSSGDKQ